MLDQSGPPVLKLDASLREMVEQGTLPDIVSVIIQTVDGLKSEDRQMLSTLKGVFKDDLHIINAYSANLPGRALETLILSPRVVRIYLDSPVNG